MADLHRWIPAFATLVLVTGLVAPASAQNGLSCTASAPTVTPTSTPPQPTLRQEGFTELTADIVLTCVGAPGATPTQPPNIIPQANIAVSLSAPVTSRVLGGTSPQFLTEALLLVDDPSPGTTYPALGNQDPCLSPLNPAVACQVVGDGGQTFNQAGKFNVFQGIAGGPGSYSITFLGVPIDPPGGTLASRTYRITNLRVDATQVGADNFSPVFAFVSASPSSSVQINNLVNSVGFVSYGLTAGTSVVGTPFPQCVSSSMTQVGTVTFTENFTTAFKVAGRTGQNQPGTVYNTESGLEIAFTGGTPGLADTGTRLQAVVSGIPLGVTVWVDDWAQSTGATGMTPSDATLVAGTVYVPPVDPGSNTPQQALSGNSATFVWEVTNTNSSAIDSLSFNIYVSINSVAAPGTAAVLSGFNPQQALATSPMTGPIPEFSSTVNVPSSATNLFTVSPCLTISGLVTLSGTGLSGVPVALSGTESGSTTTNTSGNYSFTVAPGGNYTLTPSLAGYTFSPPNLSFNSLSSSQTANFTALQDQTIAFGALANQHLGTPPFMVSATASSGLAVSFASITPAVCTVSGATVTLVTVGTCTIQATQAGNSSYAAATPVNQSFYVTPTCAGTVIEYQASGEFGSNVISGPDKIKLAGEPFSIALYVCESKTPSKTGSDWAAYAPLYMTGTVTSGLTGQPTAISAQRMTIILVQPSVGVDIAEVEGTLAVHGNVIFIHGSVALPAGTLTSTSIAPFSRVPIVTAHSGFMVSSLLPVWKPSSVYTLGKEILDPSGNVQEATTAGTSGTTAPTWNETTRGTTNDGSVVWTCQGPPPSTTLSVTGTAAATVYTGKDPQVNALLHPNGVRVITTHADGTQSVRPMRAAPVDLGAPSDTVMLRFYASGVRDASDVHVRIAGQDVPVIYSGASGHFPGFDEVTVELPRSLAGMGDVDVVLTADGQTASPVRIHIQ
jgi:hypothetical protein